MSFDVSWLFQRYPLCALNFMSELIMIWQSFMPTSPGNVKPPRSHHDSSTLLRPRCLLWHPWTQCGFHNDNHRFSVTSHPPQGPLDSCVLLAFFLQTSHSSSEAMNSSTLYQREYLNAGSSFSGWYPGHMLNTLSQSPKWQLGQKPAPFFISLALMSLQLSSSCMSTFLTWFCHESTHFRSAAYCVQWPHRWEEVAMHIPCTSYHISVVLFAYVYDICTCYFGVCIWIHKRVLLLVEDSGCLCWLLSTFTFWVRVSPQKVIHLAGLFAQWSSESGLSLPFLCWD